MSREHRHGIGRQIIHVSRLYESVSVQVAAGVFSGTWEAFVALKAGTEKKESCKSCRFRSLVGEGTGQKMYQRVLNKLGHVLEVLRLG